MTITLNYKIIFIIIISLFLISKSSFAENDFSKLNKKIFGIWASEKLSNDSIPSSILFIIKNNDLVYINYNNIMDDFLTDDLLMFNNSGNIDLVNKNVNIKYWTIQVINDDQIKILESPTCPASFKDEIKSVRSSIISKGKSFYKLSHEQINKLNIQKPHILGKSKSGLKVWSNGMQISVTEGAEVIPVRKGIVKRVVSLGVKSGYFVMVDHGKNVSTGYLPLFNLKVKEGDSIVQYQSIGEASEVDPIVNTVFF